MNEHKLYIDIERIVLNRRGFESDNEFTSAIFDEVNKHITELEAENAKLREALKPFADIAPHYDPPENDDSDPLFDMRHFPTIGMVRHARAALGENDDN